MKGSFLTPIRVLVCLVLLSCFVYACGDDASDDDDDSLSDGDAADGDEPDEDGDATEEDGDDTDQGPGLHDTGLSLVPQQDGQWNLLRGDTVLLRFPLDALQLGTVPELTDTDSYDPYWMESDDVLFGGYLPEGFVWQDLQAVTFEQTSDTQLSATADFGNGLSARLVFDLVSEGHVQWQILPQAENDPVAMIRLRPRTTETEGFYGLGEYFDTPNHRGKLRAMQIEADFGLESAYNEAHVPIPFIVGSTGWGLFVEDFHPGIFDVCRKENDLLEITFGTGVDSPDGLLVHLYAAEHPLDITRHYYETTAYPRLPARWALGPWIWRDENRDQAEVESDLAKIRELDLATSGYWIDRPYASAVNSFDFNPSQFTDPQAMIDLAHDLGFRMALWHTPYVSDDQEAAIPLHEHAVENGFFPPVTGLDLNNWSHPVDLTNPDAYDWWQGLIRNYTDMGIEGFKMDYGEDIVPGLGGTRTPWEFFDGSNELIMHARYQLFYHRVYAETIPDDAFLICRGGTYGDQANVSLIWPGDLDASLTRHGEEVEDNDGDFVVGVGGLPSALVAGQTLGVSGFPFFASDTGGYRHSPPNKETFMRWYEHTALTPAMQVGTSSNDVPWEYDNDNGFDDESLTWYRTYARLHLRLFPFFWTYAKDLHVSGRPILRSLGLAHPELGEHPWDTYLLGEELFVAPVHEEGATQRTALLPPGEWMDWFDGELYTGGQTVTVEAPLWKLPLFLKRGAVVPMLRPTIDTMSPTTEPDTVDSYVTDAGRLYAVLAAGEDGSFDIFDGAKLSQRMDGNTLIVETQNGDEFNQGFMLQIFLIQSEPSELQMDDQTMSAQSDLDELADVDSGYAFTSELGGTLWIRVPEGNHTITIPSPVLR